jgi:hypothetical protein
MCMCVCVCVCVCVCGQTWVCACVWCTPTQFPPWSGHARCRCCVAQINPTNTGASAIQSRYRQRLALGDGQITGTAAASKLFCSCGCVHAKTLYAHGPCLALQVSTQQEQLQRAALYKQRMRGLEATLAAAEAAGRGNTHNCLHTHTHTHVHTIIDAHTYAFYMDFNMESLQLHAYQRMHLPASIDRKAYSD